MKNLTNDQLAFFLGRIILGINLFVHGAIRIPKLSGFAEGMAKGFETSPLPEFLVLPFAYILPFVELILGFLLLLGHKTRNSLTASGFLIAILIFGSGIKEDWTAVSTQMVYAIFIFLLIKNLNHNALALDKK
ncbi:MauE/DoxX family redox-associated membrane protein [Aequorivita echinoideorum]|uniref:DoxX family membrane protein n=1 Tax=Aequorivita echinoideorum TaxID=1549647 RepID=A0ABS5S499_9FLAO|nr:MauE/DoxX family redox-associated membrane protein [Aequorivita echinoideorum]MBT0607212.1 DoxX family membrane protein [Aequorivita echinoideorum]